MSICPTSNSTKNKPNYPYNQNDNGRKSKDERQFSGSVPKRNTRKPQGDGRRGGYDVQKGSPVEKRDFGRQSHQYSNPDKWDRKPRKNHETNNNWPDRVGNSKKGSLNHLLNFKFEPRSRSEQWKKPSLSARSKISPCGEVFSREKFLQANCQFYVTPGGDYDVHLADPDLPVPWERVEKVRVWSEEPSSCPICLYPPFVPKITKCGHIYCWPCILHYLTLGEKNYHSCPICHEIIKDQDLRSVTVVEEESANIGDAIKMKLMCCSKSGAVPRSVFPENDEDASVGQSEVGRDVKIEEISSLDVLNQIVEREMELLKTRKEIGDLDSVEIMFHDTALAKSEKRMANLVTAISEECTSTPLSPGTTSSSSDVSDTSVVESNSSDSSDGSHAHVPPVKEGDLHYFYQCEDGRHIYIHGLNIKCLLKEFSDFGKCPSVVRGKIVEIESFTMTQASRRRHRYLSHLPLSCEFKIAEVEIESPALSVRTMEEFKGAMERRANNRIRRERQDEKMSKQAEMNARREYDKIIANNCRYSRIGAPISVTNSEGSISVLVSQRANSSIAAQIEPGNNERREVVNHESRAISPNRSSSLSFAQMLSCGEVIAPRPEAKAKSRQITASQPGNHVKLADDANSDDPDYVPPPNYQSSFGDAISAALARVSVKEEAPALKVKKGKRRKKQTLLFSTSQMQHL